MSTGLLNVPAHARLLDWFRARKGYHVTTRFEVEKAAHVLGDGRWNVWMKCGVHTWQALPQTDSGEHYCPNCCTIWTPDGAIQNIPERPSTK